MKTPAAMQNAIGCVAVLFFPRIPVSFALFLLLLSFSFSLRKTWVILVKKLSYFKKSVEQCAVIPAIT